MRVSCVLILLHGASSRPVERLGFKTPLQVAKTPNLDEITNQGVCGVVDLLNPGVATTNDIVISSLLGLKGLQIAFHEKYKNTRGSFVCGDESVSEFCMATGMQPILTLDDTNYEKKIAASKSAFENYSFLFFHINETDRIYDNLDFEALVEELEEIDDHVIKSFRDWADGNFAMAITCAPTRSPVNGRITGDPVPIAFWGRGIRRGTVKRFNESSCAFGEVGRIKAETVVPTLLDLLGLSKKYGITSG